VEPSAIRREPAPVTRPGAVAASASPTSRWGAAGVALAEMRAAVAFLTRLPVRRSSAELDRTGAAAFGLAGAAIGVVAAAPLVVLGGLLPMPAAVLALSVVVVASGGLHLDGLADTADALAAATPDAAERARTDPRAGAAGVTAIVLDLLLAGSLLAAIAAADPRLAGASIVVAATASRAAAPVAAWMERSRRIRPREGLGGWFAERVRPGDVVAVVLTTVAVAAITTIASGNAVLVLGTAAGLAVATAAASVVVLRRGQLDGDGYGAIVEITFVAILAGIAVLMAIPPS
jgi:adenosylcobinamide-GDP ribazoletransferase